MAANEPNPPEDTPQSPPEAPAGNGPTPGTRSRLANIVQLSVFTLLGAGALVFIYYAITGTQGGGVLGRINEYNAARGLITFLIAFTTVALAVILVLASIISSGEDLKMRFEQGREVFTTLIGILGTIVGFYFGATQGNPQGPGGATPTPAPAALRAGVRFANAHVSNPNPKAGETVTITTVVGSGVPPYTYSITFEPDVIPAVRDAASPDGIIRQAVPIPAGLAADTPVRFRMDVTDSRGQTVSYDGGGAQNLRVAMQ